MMTKKKKRKAKIFAQLYVASMSFNLHKML